MDSRRRRRRDTGRVVRRTASHSGLAVGKKRTRHQTLATGNITKDERDPSGRRAGGQRTRRVTKLNNWREMAFQRAKRTPLSPRETAFFQVPVTVWTLPSMHEAASLGEKLERGLSHPCPARNFDALNQFRVETSEASAVRPGKIAGPRNPRPANSPSSCPGRQRRRA